MYSNIQMFFGGLKFFNYFCSVLKIKYNFLIRKVSFFSQLLIYSRISCKETNPSMPLSQQLDGIKYLHLFSKLKGFYFFKRIKKLAS
jgi:hypothetical protein